MNYCKNELKSPTVAIAINKSVVRIFNSQIVYLDDGTEFQIELFNPTQDVLAAKISLNNKSISNSLLIIKPGQRIWLERFLDENKKFIFNTYSVENSKESIEAIKYNGRVKVEFFKEKSHQQIFYFDRNGFLDYCFQTNTAVPHLQNLKTVNGIETGYYNTTLSAAITTNTCNSIETGRVEAGNISNQCFDTYFGDFESLATYVVELAILPKSQKQIFKKDIEKKYCLNCGKKAKPKDKFCSKCGQAF